MTTVEILEAARDTWLEWRYGLGWTEASPLGAIGTVTRSFTAERRAWNILSAVSVDEPWCAPDWDAAISAAMREQ